MHFLYCTCYGDVHKDVHKVNKQSRLLLVASFFFKFNTADVHLAPHSPMRSGGDWRVVVGRPTEVIPAFKHVRVDLQGQTSYIYSICRAYTGRGIISHQYREMLDLRGLILEMRSQWDICVYYKSVCICVYM